MTVRLPTPGGDNDDWGDILNAYLEVSLNADGTLRTNALVAAGGYLKPSGGIPASDLASNLPVTILDNPTQSAIAAIAGKYVKPSNGIPASDMTPAVQTNLGLAGTAVQLGGDIGGTTTSPVIAKLQGTTVNAAIPANNQVLAYNNVSHSWVPSTVSSTTVNDATSSTPGIIQLSGDLGNTATSPEVVSTHLTSALPVAQGGTGSASQNFVDLSSNQTVNGDKTFTTTIDASISGSAARAALADTVTTNADLTGDVTSSGNSTALTASSNVESIISSNSTVTSKAPLNSPAFTGIPTAPTAATGVSTAQVATTAFVDNSVTSGAAANATPSTPGLIQLDGDLGNTATSPEVVATHLAAALPIDQGGTGSQAQNFLTLGGDIGTSVTNPTVASIQGVAISGIPNTGQALIASSSGAAAWNTLSAGNFGAAQALNPTPKLTASYSAAANDLAKFDISGGSISQTLPQTPADKSLYAAKIIGSNSPATNTLTLTTQGSDVINKTGGSTSYILKLLNQSALLQYQTSGAIWNVLGDDLPLGGLDGRYMASGGLTTTGTPMKGQSLIVTSSSTAAWGNINSWFNVVTQFGADNTVATDASVAIQNAINAANTAGGGVVYLPAGKYLLKSGLTMFSKITIKGDGALVSLLYPSPDATQTISAAISTPGTSLSNQTTQTCYEDFGISGPGQNSSFPCVGIGLNYCTTGTSLNRLFITNMSSHGIAASQSYTVQCSSLFLSFCGGDGLNANNNFNSWMLSGCTSLGNTGSGYYVMGGAASVFSCCDAESNGNCGYYILGTFSFSIIGGEIESNGSVAGGKQSGIYLGQGTGSYGTCENTVIQGCWIQGGSAITTYGIQVDVANATQINNIGFQNMVTYNIYQPTGASANTIIGSQYYSTIPAGGNIKDFGTSTTIIANTIKISQSSTVGSLVTIQNTHASPGSPNLFLSSIAANDQQMGTAFAGNTAFPYVLKSSGSMTWGTGSGPTDTTLSRSAIGVLNINNAIGVSGLAGATTGTSRYAGATVSGAPGSGTFALGDFIIDNTGAIWICTTAGTVGSGCVFVQTGGGVASFNTRTGAVVPAPGDYTAAQVSGAADKSASSAQTFTGNVQAPALVASGLPGAGAASRYAGATVSGAPGSGTFALGDFIIDQSAGIWICTTAGVIGSGCVFTKAGGVSLDSTASDIQPAGTQAAGATGRAADAGHVHPLSPIWTPVDFGLISWSHDPVINNLNGLLINGQTAFAAIPVRYAQTITNLLVNISAVAGSLATGNFLGLYSSNGTTLTQVAATTDQTSTGKFTALGLCTIALSSPYLSTSGMYYVAVMTNSSAASTLKLGGLNINSNVPNSVTPKRYGAYTTTGTGLPASVPLSSVFTPTNVYNWAAGS